jgi:hypothetical protein
MEKMIFNADDIHKLRVELAERREHMTPEEARRDFDARVAGGKRRIEEMREAKANAPMQNAQ